MGRRTDIARMQSMIETGEQTHSGSPQLLWMNHGSILDLLTPDSMCFLSGHVASIGCDLKFILPAEHSSVRRASFTGPQQDKLPHFDMLPHARRSPATRWPLLITGNTTVEVNPSPCACWISSMCQVIDEHHVRNILKGS